jgi:TRAP-type C4-dicarboxylate transport system substrate-binding protein
MNMRTSALSLLVLVLGVALPGTARVALAKGDNHIRIATLAPRDSDFIRGFKRINYELRKSTRDEWSIQLYPSGIAGDEQDVIRKMRVGQMDATAVTSVGLSQVLRELAVLTAPGAIETYEQLDRVQKALNKEWADKLAEHGFKLLGWGEVGLLRFFTSSPLHKPTDLRALRPWVWPPAHTLKALWAAIGCSGVPLGVPEVYGGLQTGMINAVVTSALAAVALQWHSALTFVTQRSLGPLVGGLLITSKKWLSIPEHVRTTLQEQIRTNYEGDSKNIREDDEIAYQKLLKRGYTATAYTAGGEQEFQAVEKKARDSLVGRIYSQELLERVLKLAKGG